MWATGWAFDVRFVVHFVLEAIMNLLWSFVRIVGTSLVLCALNCVSLPCSALIRIAPTTSAQPGQTAATDRDGQHDFDFNIGTWKTHIRRLQHPLTGSTTWTEMNGTVVVRRIWDGRAQLEEVEADGPNGHFEDLALFLYNPQSHQWNFTFANSKVGELSQPSSVGEFKNGRGEFYDQEAFNGRTILVRIIWGDITADSHRFEQAFSDDGGKTWETNMTADLTREKS
jgi:hypothetical protein